jgi:2-keto-3-deoxy-L-rhamnonate aldolase RhmA
MSMRDLCRSRALKLGHFIAEFATPGIGHILKNAGCDYALLDMEHSGFSFETVKSLVRYCEAAGLPAIVRVPSKAYDHIARAADIGAEAIMVPMVDTDAEARALVAHLKYTPQGHRGVGLGLAHENYRNTGSVDDRLAAANARTCLIAQIETASGAEHADAIAAVDGVDCLWIGHFDLTASLGVPGKFDHPSFESAVEGVIAACRKHGKSLGRLVANAEIGIAHANRGFDFVCWSGDVWALQEAVCGGVDAIRTGARAPAKAKRARG